jgi:hypothetical protein
MIYGVFKIIFAYAFNCFLKVFFTWKNIKLIFFKVFSNGCDTLILKLKKK